MKYLTVAISDDRTAVKHSTAVQWLLESGLAGYDLKHKLDFSGDGIVGYSWLPLYGNPATTPQQVSALMMLVQ